MIGSCRANAFGALFIGLAVIVAILGSIIWGPALDAPMPSASASATEKFAAAANGRAAPVVMYSENPLNHLQWAALRSFGTWDVRNGDARALAETVLSGQDIPAALRPSGAESVLAVLDPRDLEQLTAESGNTITRVATAPAGYFVILSGLQAAQSRDPDVGCTFEWRGKTIGYLQRTDLLFIQSLLRGYRIPEDAVKLVQIPMGRWDALGELLENKEVYRIVTYVVPGSPFIGMLKRQRVYPQGFTDINAAWVQAFYPYASLEEAPLATMFNDSGISTQAFVFPKDAYGPLFKMAQPVVLLEGQTPAQGATVASSAAAEGFTVSRLENPVDAYDPSYRCFGNRSAGSKAECESPYDVIGNLKDSKEVWDRPCFRNSDCPFWNESTAEISRGGCKTGGVCEMPAGVRATGFRRNEGTPFCYGCTDATKTDCCASQDQPDYVFQGDTEARKALEKEVLLYAPGTALG